MTDTKHIIPRARRRPDFAEIVTRVAIAIWLAAVVFMIVIGVMGAV